MSTVTSPIVAIALTVAAVAFVLIATESGMRVGPRDGPSYMSSAENLAAGNGYQTSYGDPGKAVDFESTTSPVIQFPPGYPALLSVALAAGADTATGARLLSAVLLALITLVIYILARRRGFTVLGAFAASSVGLVLSFPWALIPQSELLFGLLLLLVLIATAASIRIDRPQLLWAAAVLAAGATAVRTVGLALVGVVVIVAWSSAMGWRRRIGMSLTMFLIGVLPFVIFTAGGGSRELAWHPPGVPSMRVAARAVASWVIPPTGSGVVRVALLLVVLLILGSWVLSARRSTNAKAQFPQIWLPGLLSAAGIIGIILLARSFYGVQVEANQRLLYPVALSLLMTGVESYPGFELGSRGMRARQALAAIAVLAVFAGVWASMEEFITGPPEGYIFSADSFTRSEGILFAVTSLEGAAVFSNIPEGLWYAGLPNARPLPAIFDSESLRPSQRLGDEIAELRIKINSGGVIVYSRGFRKNLMSLDDLRGIAPCEVLDDGRVVLMTGVEHPLCESLQAP